eukprot:14486918-Alexandrium_andersonii.AAC.1
MPTWPRSPEWTRTARGSASRPRGLPAPPRRCEPAGTPWSACRHARAQWPAWCCNRRGTHGFLEC